MNKHHHQIHQISQITINKKPNPSNHYFLHKTMVFFIILYFVYKFDKGERKAEKEKKIPKKA